jgi:hypothetical protein
MRDFGVHQRRHVSTVVDGVFLSDTVDRRALRAGYVEHDYCLTGPGNCYLPNLQPSFGPRPRPVAFVLETTVVMTNAIQQLHKIVQDWALATTANYWFNQYVLVTFNDKGMFAVSSVGAHC